MAMKLTFMLSAAGFQFKTVITCLMPRRQEIQGMRKCFH
jgi:hypothetical protein